MNISIIEVLSVDLYISKVLSKVQNRPRNESSR